MKILMITVLLGMLILAGCGEVAEETVEETANPSLTQTVLSDAVPVEKLVTVERQLRIVDYRLDPEEIMVPANSMLSLSVDADKEMVLSFELDGDEKIITTSEMTFLFKVGEPGVYEYNCVSGCPIPLIGSIIAE